MINKVIAEPLSCSISEQTVSDRAPPDKLSALNISTASSVGLIDVGELIETVEGEIPILYLKNVY